MGRPHCTQPMTSSAGQLVQVVRTQRPVSYTTNDRPQVVGAPAGYQMHRPTMVSPRPIMMPSYAGATPSRPYGAFGTLNSPTRIPCSTSPICTSDGLLARRSAAYMVSSPQLGPG